MLTKPIVAKSTFAMRVGVRALDGSGPMWHPLLVNYSTDQEVIYEATDSVHLAGAKGKDRVKVVLSKDVVKKDGETLGEYAKRKGYGVTAINANEKVQIGYLQLDAKAGLDKDDDYMVDHCVKHCPRWTPGASLTDFELKTLRRALGRAPEPRRHRALRHRLRRHRRRRRHARRPGLAHVAEARVDRRGRRPPPRRHGGGGVRARAQPRLWVQLWGRRVPSTWG